MQTQRAISTYFRDIDGLVNRFHSVHSESLAYMSSITNTAERLEYFREPSSLGILTRFQNANVLLERKHLQSCDSLMKALMLSLFVNFPPPFLPPNHKD
jgi:hypothetical protein